MEKIVLVPIMKVLSLYNLISTIVLLSNPSGSASMYNVFPNSFQSTKITSIKEIT